ncbi:MarR family winged helix-turn-helix transcriptional regulator [Microbacter margulisiae]|uniref:DNA-binding MarR family transcriptional regulator n=1 Tax=Microbacter margulisiae TaxID=1350067 RepID=A0A7W5DR42_9PORP|nr:winged helix DNA-binding protein [Microbacter margulisiae]MBB3186718.1 DNA-binding MarR family transcriptional regulator [Microbacter margulisiae]
MRNIYKAVNQCEKEFASKYGLTLNEAMILCSLETKSLCASELAEVSDLQCSQTSKILKSLEDKELIQRTLGKTDKRNMFFGLSEKGEAMLKAVNAFQQNIPELLKPLL